MTAQVRTSMGRYIFLFKDLDGQTFIITMWIVNINLPTLEGIGHLGTAEQLKLIFPTSLVQMTGNYGTVAVATLLIPLPPNNTGRPFNWGNSGTNLLL